MLRVARISDRTGRYYLTDLAFELDAAWVGLVPPGPREPRSGRWLGTGAAGLGLVGRADADAFGALLSGCHPSGHHRLRARETAVSGYDLTFAAPKSVSVLFALGGLEAAAAVRAAHDEAVGAAVGYVEARAATVRCTLGDSSAAREPAGLSAGLATLGPEDAWVIRPRVTSPVDGVVGASFVHGVSRALDPHLHSHAVVANLARGPDGRWRAIDSRGLYAHASAAGALYDAVLRRGITVRLGLEWDVRASRAWELSVVSPALAAALSTRRGEILADAHAHSSSASPVTRHARRVAWAVTREPKGPMPTPGVLRRRWSEIALDAGCPLELAAVGHRHGRHGRPERVERVERVERASIDEHRFAAVISEAGRGVARRDALAAWAGSLDVGASGEDVGRCVDMLADWGTGSGVAERPVAPGAVVPHPHVLRLLGPRPAAPRALDVWESAASTIARFRARWGVRDRLDAFGAGTPAELRALPARRLADHLATTREIDGALARLGRPREPLRDQGLERSRGLW